MHEAAVAQLILDVATRRAGGSSGAGNVKTIHVRVGEFRNIDPESLNFAFEAIKAIYPDCISATLQIEVVRPLAVCLRGHKYVASASLEYRCPDCGQGVSRLLSGEELEITGIDCSQTDEVKCHA